MKLEAYCQVWRGGGEEGSQARVGAEAAGCRQGGRLACGGAMGQRPRAYIEHGSHVRDLRDVPVQGLVEAGGALPVVERGRRGMLRLCVGAEAAGCRQGGRLVGGGAMGQRPGRT